jgi:delta24(24(1))-sterol reductase
MVDIGVRQSSRKARILEEDEDDETPRSKSRGPKRATSRSRSVSGRKRSVKREDIDDSPDANGSADKSMAAKPRARAASRKPSTGSRTRSKREIKAEAIAKYDFGGPLGVSAMMVGFPLLMLYMFIGAHTYGGKLPLPQPKQNYLQFLGSLAGILYEEAFPSARAWLIYGSFFFLECAAYVYLPGIMVRGKPLPHENGTMLNYYCSGVAALYSTLAGLAVLQFTGLFPLAQIVDEFGPLLSVSIISGFLGAIILFVSAKVRRAEHEMSGNLI